MHFSDQVIEALKWVGIVFIAGFIGYFGRYLGMVIIERLHKKKKEQPSIIESPEKISTGKENVPEKEALKVEKKRLKAAHKAGKREDSG